MPFDDRVASEVLAKCGRRCCICRRFKPTLLQVHHIELESEGGDNSIENAIALCINCHSDVHTSRPFTRRFTTDELRAHRDNVYRLVASGSLLSQEEYTPAFQVVNQARRDFPEFNLSNLAAELLVAGAEDKYGIIMLLDHLGGCDLQAGQLRRELGFGRERAKHFDAMRQLDTAGLVEQSTYQHGGTWKVTYPGYEVADTLGAMSSTGEHVAKS